MRWPSLYQRSSGASSGGHAKTRTRKRPPRASGMRWGHRASGGGHRDALCSGGSLSKYFGPRCSYIFLRNNRPTCGTPFRVELDARTMVLMHSLPCDLKIFMDSHSTKERVLVYCLACSCCGFLLYAWK